MENNINKIIANSLMTNNLDISTETIINIIKKIKIAIYSNKEAIIQANKIDIKNNNGFTIDFNVIDNIFNLIDKENIIYGNVVLSQKDEGIIYGKQIMNLGNIVVLNDGNTYVIMEMILRNILANNTVIFNNNGYMYGTNNLLITICQSVLEQFNISKYLIQMYISDSYEELLKNFASINLVVCIGNHDLQQSVLSISKIPTIVSGYDNFDIYIEDKTHIEFINEIIKTKLNINIYINSSIELDYENAIIVEDIDEAIGVINYNGHKYSAAIFTDSKENAAKFIKEVHSKMITVNTSPTIERICDIKQSDLVLEKTIIYPVNFKFDGTQENIEII